MLTNQEADESQEAQPTLRPPGPNDLKRTAGRGWQRMPWGWHHERYGDIRCKVSGKPTKDGKPRFGKVLAWGPAAGVSKNIPMPTSSTYARRLLRALADEIGASAA